MEELDDSTFWGCKKLAKVNIPDGIKEIESSVFYECGSLKGITIPDSVTAIGRSAFSNCTNLEKIEIPESVDEIGMYAFKNCKKLKKVRIPSGVTVIDENLFDGCSSLTEVDLPDELDSIKEYAFSECINLKKCSIPAGVSEIEQGVFEECHVLERVEIPQGVTEIPANMCNNCKGLKEIVFHDAVESIGDYAFNGCGSLKEIDLPESLVRIEDGAFNECRGLTTVEIPDNVEYIGQYAFDDCDNLKEVSMPAHEVELCRWALPDRDETTITYREADAGKPAWTPKPKKRDPDMSDLEAACDALGCSCWNGSLTECRRKNIEEIEIPEGITAISSNVFANFTKLRSVRIPDTVAAIEMSAFKGCTALEEIEIPDSVTELQGWVFEDCAELVKAKLPAGITAIGYSLFRNCGKLAEVEIPEGVTVIEGQAFNGCAALTEITLPDSIEKIDSWAFDNCSSLETVYMPDKEIETEGRVFPAKAEIVKIPVGDSAAKAAAKKANSTERYTKVTPADEIYSHYGKLKREHDKFSGMGIMHVSNNGCEHEAIPLTGLMERQGKTDNAVYKKLKSIESKDKYDLKDLALKMAQVFRVDQSVFNARHDDEGEIGVTMLDQKWKFSALRSFAWTLADMADREGKSIEDYDTDELLGICGFIKKREWLNYEGGSWFDALCGHNDIHVYYMPQKMIDDGTADGICDVFNYNPIVSLDAFRNDLATLKNPMIRLHNRILENRDRSVKLDSPEAAVLKAWCSMVMSAETAFFSEDGPMMFFHEYPDTPPNTKPLSVGPGAAAPKKAAPKKKQEEPSAAMQSAASYEIVKGPDGKERIKLGEYPAGQPVVWLVMENNKDDLLLLSEYGLSPKAFNDISYTYAKTGSFGENTYEWHNCTLRQWLNDEFMNEAFSQAEKDMILDDTHDTYTMDSRGKVEETAAVTDKVFLLGVREIKKFFPTQRDMICKATDYAKQEGAEIESGPMQCHWWARSPGVELMPGLKMWAGCVMASGEVKGWGVTAANVCVRPVVRVKKALVNPSSSGQEAKTEPAEAPAPKKPAAKKAAPKAKEEAKPAAEPAASPKKATPKAKTAAKSAAKAAPGEVTLDLGGSKVIKDNQFMGYKDAAKVIIPEGVTEIGSRAFKDSLIEEIVFPKSLKKIGSWAFHGSKKLKSAELNNGIESIEMNAFQGCPLLRDITLPDSIKEIDPSAFASANGYARTPMIHLSDSLARRLETAKGNHYWDSLCARRFEIDGDYFDSLKKYLEYWTKNKETEDKWAGKETQTAKAASGTRSSAAAVKDLQKADSFEILDMKGQTVVKQGQFRNLKIRRLEIPEGVTEIEYTALSFNDYLEIVKLPRSMRKIGEQAFGHNGNLREIILNEGLREIGSIAFVSCEKMEEITLPDSMQKVSRSAFVQNVIGLSSHMTVRMSGNTAVRLRDNREFLPLDTVIAGRFVIDGKNYSTIEDYLVYREKERERREEEERKQRQRNMLRKQIHDLEVERDSAKGLFAGMKRNKLQRRIDELNDELRRI